MIGGSDTGNQVLQLVEEWVPEKAYRSEARFRDDLQRYLDERLNSSGGLLGQNRTYAVRKEYGKSNADLAVDTEVGIELKRDLTNGKTRRLESQINDYIEEFPHTIVCACGIKDKGRWNELRQRYEGNGGGLGLDSGSAVWFVTKEKDGRTFRSDSGNESSDGPFGGDSDFGLGDSLF